MSTTVRVTEAGESRCTECDCTYPPHCCPDCGVATVTAPTAEEVERGAIAAWVAAAWVKDADPRSRTVRNAWGELTERQREHRRRIARAVLETRGKR